MGTDMPAQGIGFTGLGHVAIRVADVDRCLAFYAGKLGLLEMFRLHRDDGRLWLLYLRITDTQYLEVFPDAAAGSRAPEETANGLNHLCLTVGDIEAAVRRLEAAGIPLHRPLKQGADGNRQAWILDPDGNRIELMEMAADGLQIRAIERLSSQRPSQR
jgi:lactoylglutathione lyase